MKILTVLSLQSSLKREWQEIFYHGILHQTASLGPIKGTLERLRFFLELFIFDINSLVSHTRIRLQIRNLKENKKQLRELRMGPEKSMQCAAKNLKSKIACQCLD